MSQPTPAYTDADVELVARAIFFDDFPEGRTSGLAVDGLMEEYRQNARAALDALVERGHGLAPVIAHQWSVRYPDGFVDRGSFTEAGARRRAAELVGEVVYRAVGSWTPAPVEVKP